MPERFLDDQGKLNDNVFNPSKAAFGFGRRYVAFDSDLHKDNIHFQK
jgi:hypothetical protein